MNDTLKGLRERISRYSVTALYPSMRCLVRDSWDEKNGFADKESEEFFEQVLDVAEKFVQLGDKTGISHYVLYLGTLVVGGMAEQQENETLYNECVKLADRYIHESVNLGFNLAYCDLGKALFFGNGIWQKDEEEGLSLMKQAIDLPVRSELGMDPDFIKSLVKETYEECSAQYSATHQAKESTVQESVKLSTSQGKRPAPKRRREYTAGYYLAGAAAFIGYILVSFVLRVEFGLQSAYDLTIEGNWFWGIIVSLLLNYSVIPVLLMAYLNKKDTGKHSIILVGLYIIFLIGCYIDGFMPYISRGNLMEGANLFYAILHPTIFLVSHRLLSLLIWSIISKQEGSSDYKIYYGLTLFAPFMVLMLIWAVIFWITQSGSSENREQNTGTTSTVDLQDSVRQDLSAEVNSIGVYYDDGWKVVDYWNNSSSLSEISGADRGKTYFKDSGGNIYTLPTNHPDQNSVYYFE